LNRKSAADRLVLVVVAVHSSHLHQTLQIFCGLFIFRGQALAVAAPGRVELNDPGVLEQQDQVSQPDKGLSQTTRKKVAGVCSVCVV